MTKFASIREYTAENEYPLKPEDVGDYTQETYNMWVYDPDQDVGLNIWFGAGYGSWPKFRSTFLVFDKGTLWECQNQGLGNPPEGVGGGNTFLSIVEPFKTLKVDFLGLTNQINNNSQIVEGSVPQLGKANLVVETVAPPIENGTQGDRGDVAASGIVPRTALRYEQLCRVTGLITIGSREIRLNALGMRSHRRNSVSIYAAGAVGHTWITGLFPSGRGFHMCSYQVKPDAKVGSLYGHYFDGKALHEVEITRFPFYSGSFERESYKLEMQLGGKVITIEGTGVPPAASVIPPEGVRLTRSPGRFILDGEVGGGILERSLLSEFKAGGDYTG